MPIKESIKSPKRIAILIDSLTGGGAEKVMLTLAQSMINMGHDAHIIALSNTVAYDLPEDIPVTFLYKEKVRLKGWFGAAKHASKLMRLVKDIESKANGGPFDLFLANLLETSRIVSKCDFSPVYHVIHNSMGETLNRSKLMGPIKYLYYKNLINSLNGQHLIAVSKGVENEIRDTGIIKPAIVVTIYNPFDAELIRDASTVAVKDIDNIGPYLVHVGRAARQKRHDILFEALRQVKGNLRLVCLSDNVPKLRKLAIKHGVEDRVVLPGFQVNPYPWIANAEAMVLSSDYEGFSSVVVEAVICGTLPISTNCPHGPNEIMTGDLARFLSDVRDPAALAKNIDKRLSVDFDFSKADVLSKITPENVVSRYLSLIET